MIRCWVVLAICASCVQSNEVTCADGRLCAPGYTCDNENHRCLSAEQVAACAGRDEGAECSFGGAPGACRKGACEALVCGDGIRSIGEACDGADLGDANCTDAGFYEPDGLACSEFCTFNVSGCTGECGDNLINGNELCDGAPPVGTCFGLGFDAGTLGCAPSCGYSFEHCGRFGWTAEPITMRFATSVSGTSPTDLWVVGEDNSQMGVIAHYDGVSWGSSLTGNADLLKVIYSVTPTDVWLLSEPAIVAPSRPLRLINAQWSTVTDAPLGLYTDVWAASATAVFFTTEDIGVVWWNGTTWQPLGNLTGSLVAIEGTSAADLWVAKSDGSLVRWTGGAWTPIDAGVKVKKIEAIALDDVWVIGENPTMAFVSAIAHWNGSAWTVYTDPFDNPSLGISAFASNDIWIAGASGVVKHWDGTEWTTSESSVFPNPGTGGLVGILHFGDAVIGVSFDAFAYRYRGQAYFEIDDTVDFFAAQTIWSSGPNDTFFGDSRGRVVRYNGIRWTTSVVDPNTPPQVMSALWGSGPTDVWASGGAGRVYRWNGSVWSAELAALGSVEKIWGSGPNDVWFVGNTVTHFNGSQFMPNAPVFTGALIAAGGSGPNDVWVVANETALSSDLYRWNGSVWTKMTIPYEVSAIAVVASNDVFVTADGNHILHYDGTMWTDTAVVAINPLDNIVATAHDDVIASTTNQLIYFDGTTWTPLRPPSDPALAGPTVVMTSLWAAPGRIDLLYRTNNQQQVRRLIRTRRWACRASETACSDGVDDDCDMQVDALDADCP